jgi:hypothetical protein
VKDGARGLAGGGGQEEEAEEAMTKVLGPAGINGKGPTVTQPTLRQGAAARWGHRPPGRRRPS